MYQPKRIWHIHLFGYHKGRRELLVCDSGCSVPVNHALGIHCHALMSQTECHCFGEYTALHKMVQRAVPLWNYAIESKA